jgi:hypothetical protein
MPIAHEEVGFVGPMPASYIKLLSIKNLAPTSYESTLKLARTYTLSGFLSSGYKLHEFFYINFSTIRNYLVMVETTVDRFEPLAMAVTVAMSLLCIIFKVSGNIY